MPQHSQIRVDEEPAVPPAAVPDPADPSPRRSRRDSMGPRASQGMLGIVARLSLVNSLVLFASVVTGPLQARALGPAGRGEVAAILVPPVILTYLWGLGMNQYVSMRAAQLRALGPLVGSILAVQLVISVVAVAVGIPLASFLAHGRPRVHLFLLLNFCMLPLGLIFGTAFAVANGRGQWGRILFVRACPPLLTVAAFVALFALSDLTVTAVAIVTLAASLAAGLPLVLSLRECLPLSLHRAYVAEGLRFGVKSWLTSLSNLINARLDQFVLIVLVSSSQLGLYAVAVTASEFATVLSSSQASALIPRVARGDHALGARSIRILLPLIVAVNAGAALAAPLALPLVFGHGFRAAVPVVWLLLLAAVPLAGAAVLSQVLVTSGFPGKSAIAQGVGAAITVPGLLVAVPLLGIIGAALVSVVAYTVSFAMLLYFCKRHFGHRLSDYLVPRAGELRATLRAIGLRLRPRLPGRAHDPV
jgi:O-antigen/teichoic acid export membrane protein